MDTRVSELFGPGSGHSSGSQVVGSTPGNGFGMPSKKACAKINKKAKARSPRNFKPSNNTPYLPPEVSRKLRAYSTASLFKIHPASIIYEYENTII